MVAVVFAALVLVGRTDEYGIRVYAGDSWASRRKVFAEARYPHPPDISRTVIEDYSRYHKLVPHLAVSDVLPPMENRQRVYFRFKTPLILADYWSIVSITTENEGGGCTIAWELMDGNVRQNQGILRLKPDGDEGSRTQVSIEAELNPGGVLPHWLVMREVRKHLSTALRRIGKEIAQAHRRDDLRRDPVREKVFPRAVPSKTAVTPPSVP